jgi:hypothetical protein
MLDRTQLNQLSVGARINLRPSYFALVCQLILLISIVAAFCAAQSAPQPENSNANQSAQPPATGAGQAPQQTPPPSKPSAGQPSTGQTAQPADQTQSQDKDSQGAKDAANGTTKDRLFFALPNFLTVENAGKIPPLTAGQKFKVVARGSFDPIQIVWYGALAGISQAENSEPGYGQGAEGYGKRFAAYAADGTIENFFVGAILPSVLHQDPRFFQKAGGSFFDRAGYAVSRIVVTRSDSGLHQFNFSEIFGAAIASAISTYSYHPGRTLIGRNSEGVPRYTASDRTLKNTASVWGSQVGYDTITLVVKEFWPDIRRKLKKQHQ